MDMKIHFRSETHFVMKQITKLTEIMSDTTSNMYSNQPD